jgi:hypothetical protein
MGIVPLMIVLVQLPFPFIVIFCNNIASNRERERELLLKRIRSIAIFFRREIVVSNPDVS